MVGDTGKDEHGSSKIKRRKDPKEGTSGKKRKTGNKKDAGVVKGEGRHSGAEVKEDSNTKTMDTVRKILRDKFGFKKFRGQQGKAICAAIQGRDCLVLMPTGGGKSLCYTLPSFVKPGLTLVISPLIALMQDQVNQLSKQGVLCDFVTSTRSTKDRKQILKKMVASPPGLQLLYVAPELLLLDGFLALLSSVHSAGFLSLVAIDESHCISSWGHDFRPAYRKLAILKTKFPGTPVMALTATADERVREDISQSLKLSNPLLLIDSFNRPNIHYSVQYVDEELQDPLHCVRSAINKEKVQGRVPSCIIYVRKQDMADDVAAYLNSVGIRCESYHAGLKVSIRSTVLNKWQKGEIPVVAATVAFGMGIDKPDVRLVVHFNMPQSMAAFYQESGRAGRDGKPSHSIIFYSIGEERQLKRILVMPPGLSKSKKASEREPQSTGKSSNEIARELAEIAARTTEAKPIENDVEEGSQMEDDYDPNYGAKARERRLDAFEEVVQYCLSISCRRRIIMSHFGESISPAACRKSCDACKDPKGVERSLDEARRIPEGNSDSDPGDDFGLARHKWRESREDCAAREAADRAAKLSVEDDDFWTQMEAAEKSYYRRSPGPPTTASRMKAKPDVTCYKCGEEGHISYECQKRSMPGFMKASAGPCFKCGETGHFAGQCNQSFGPKTGNMNCLNRSGNSTSSSPGGGPRAGFVTARGRIVGEGGFVTARGKVVGEAGTVSGGVVVQRVSSGVTPFAVPRRRVVEKKSVVKVAALPPRGEGVAKKRLQGSRAFLARAREASQGRKNG